MSYKHKDILLLPIPINNQIFNFLRANQINRNTLQKRKQKEISISKMNMKNRKPRISHIIMILNKFSKNSIETNRITEILRINKANNRSLYKIKPIRNNYNNLFKMK